MKRFLHRYKDRIAGNISGFDRMRFTGTFTVDGPHRWDGKVSQQLGSLAQEFR